MNYNIVLSNAFPSLEKASTEAERIRNLTRNVGITNFPESSCATEAIFDDVTVKPSPSNDDGPAIVVVKREFSSFSGAKEFAFYLYKYGRSFDLESWYTFVIDFEDDVQSGYFNCLRVCEKGIPVRDASGEVILSTKNAAMGLELCK